MQIECVAQTNDILGEGVIWNPGDNCLYWVDAFGPFIRQLEYATGKVTSWKMPEIMGVS